MLNQDQIGLILFGIMFVISGIMSFKSYHDLPKWAKDLLYSD